MLTLNLVGAGRVGQTLGRLWQTQGVFALQDVLTRSPSSAQAACTFMGGGTAVHAMASLRAADVWMLAVPDAAIAQTAHGLAQALAEGALPASNATSGASRPPVVFHCSGAQSALQLQPLADRGWTTASAHCILSFASPQDAPAQFPGTACALEGSAPALQVLQPAFASIGAQCFTVQSQDKLLYHAAAVFATNFLPVLQSVAEAAWQASGVPAELLPSLRSALLHNAVANITRLGPAGALTGPAARGDVAAIATQAQAVRQWDAQAGAAYEALSALALRLAKSSTETKASTASTR